MKANRFFLSAKENEFQTILTAKGFWRTGRKQASEWNTLNGENMDTKKYKRKIQRKFDYITLGSFDTKIDKILCHYLKGKEKRWALVRNALKFAENFFFQELSKSSPGARCKNLPAWDLELHLNGGSFNLSETLNHFFRGGKIFHSWLLENNTKTRLQHILCILKSSL